MRFEIAGQLVEIVGDAGAVALIAGTVASIGASQIDRSPDVIVRGTTRPIDGGARPKRALLPWYFHGLVQVSRGEGWVRVDDGATFADVRVDGSEVALYVADARTPERRALREVTIRMALLAALRGRDVFELHGGLVELAPGDGCLVVGASGSGKSTLTSALAESGFAPLGDDTALLWIDGGALRLSALPRPFFLGDRAIDAMPRLKPGARASAFHGEKWIVDPSDAWATPTTRVLRPARVLMPEIGVGEPASTVTAMSHAEAFGELVAASAMLLDDAPPRRDLQLSLLKALVSDDGALRLRLGADLLARPVETARALVATSPSRPRTTR
jgi:hypothetical protein